MAGQFFLYINRLTRMTPLQQEKLQVRVYQDWPVRIPKPPNPDGSKTTSELELFEGVPAPGNPCLFGTSKDSNYEIEFLQRYGSGKFRILINELGVLNAICSLSLEIHDPDYPPKIAPEDVDLIVGANQNYIRQMRDRGVVFPGEQQQEDEEDEEVNAELVNTSIENAKELGKLTAEVGQLKTAPASPAYDPQVLKASVEFVQDMAKDAVDAAKENATQQIEAVKATFGKGVDLDHVVDAVVKLGGVSKKDDSASVLVQILDRRNELLEKELSEMRRESQQHTQAELEFLRNRVLQPAAVSTGSSTPSSPIEQYKQAVEFVKSIKAELGGEDKPQRESFWSANLDRLLPIAMNFGNGLLNVIGAVVTRQGGMGQLPQPNPPQPGQQIVQQPQVDQDEFFAIQQGLAKDLIPYMRKITQPLLYHWTRRPQTNGYTFAEWVMQDGMGIPTDEGRLAYLTIKTNIGMEGLLQALKAWRPIWMTLSQSPAEELTAFVQEFLTYEEWQAAQDEPEVPLPNGRPVPMPLRQPVTAS